MIIRRILFFLIASIVLTASVKANHSILTWDENPDYLKYKIYWTQNSGIYSDDNSVETTENYIDLQDSPNGEEYYYTIVAVNSCGQSSDYTEEIKTHHVPGSSNSIMNFSEPATSNSKGCFIEALR